MACFPHPLVWQPRSGCPLEILHFLEETYPTRTRGMEQPYAENFTILTLAVFNWSTRVTDGRTGHSIYRTKYYGVTKHKWTTTCLNSCIVVETGVVPEYGHYGVSRNVILVGYYKPALSGDLIDCCVFCLALEWVCVLCRIVLLTRQVASTRCYQQKVVRSTTWHIPTGCVKIK